MYALLVVSVVAVYAAFMAPLLLSTRKDKRRFDAEQAARVAEHQAQLVELAEQRRLRELEELRRGLLRGRDRSCAFCQIEHGCLDGTDLCRDVEACLERAEVSTSLSST